MKLKRIFLLLALLMFTACSNEKSAPNESESCIKTSPNTVLFNYNDFGLQTTAYEVIGSDWWQWQSCGQDCDKKGCPINVVVYRNITLDKVKELHPVNEKKKKDFRYIHYDEALKYLEKTIEEMEAETEYSLTETTNQLKQTRACILNQM